MKKQLTALMVIIGLLISAAALAASNDCSYYEQNGDHSWNQIDVSMTTCTQDGYYILKCTECGKTQKEITGEAYGHTWDKTEAVDATCVDNGHILYTCSECGEQEYELVRPYGHVWKKTGEVAGTCTHPSYIHYSCANDCGDTKTDTIKAPGHTWKDLYEIQPATCTLAGSMKTECKVCGEIGTRIIKIVEHEFGEWIITKAVDNGMCVQIRSCIMCGKQETEEFYPEGTLYRGIKDREAVKELQRMLSDCGYLNDTIDGVFGKKTEMAVKGFQQENGISADGIAWPQTIGKLTAKWEVMKGIAVTPEPTQTPAVPDEPVQEIVLSCCTRIENQDGSEEIVYCEDHQVLLEMCEAFLNAAATEDSWIRALNQCRNLWMEEVDLLYAEWALNAADADKAAIENGKAMFDSYLASQEVLWKMQYGKTPEKVTEKINDLLIDQCVSLCGIVGESGKNQIHTPKGFVSVDLIDGWYVGEAASSDSIALHNDAVGVEASAWVAITDSQLGGGIEQTKQIVMFAYAGREFSEIMIGENLYHYISNSDGTVFTLVAETSTGKAMKVEGRNCSLEQAMSLLETIVIR